MILDLCVISVNLISCPKLLSVLSTPPDSSPYWSHFSSFTLYLNLPGLSVLSSFVSAYLSPLRPFSLVLWFGWEESRSLWPSAQKVIHEKVLLFHNALLHNQVLNLFHLINVRSNALKCIQDIKAFSPNLNCCLFLFFHGCRTGLLMMELRPPPRL